MEDWHRFGLVTTTPMAASNINGVSTGYIDKVVSSHMTLFSLIAHGIYLYQDIPSAFFNSYIPYTYGSWNIRTPEDPGLYMVNFCLYPGSHQPSGSINISRAREFYFKYTSTYITSTLTADLIANAVAINFLLVTDGSALMRYFFFDVKIDYIYQL